MLSPLTSIVKSDKSKCWSLMAVFKEASPINAEPLTLISTYAGSNLTLNEKSVKPITGFFVSATIIFLFTGAAAFPAASLTL